MTPVTRCPVRSIKRIERSMNTSTAIPNNLNVIQRAGYLQIQYAWVNIFTIRFLVAALAWDGFLGWFFLVPVGSSKQPISLFLLGVLCLLGVTGLVLTYVALAHVINKTEITINNEEIISRITPIPWPGSVSFKLINVMKLESGRGSGRIMASQSANVYVIDRYGVKKKLIDNLKRADQAEYIVAAVSSFLRASGT